MKRLAEDDDDSYTISSWADSKALKKNLIGVDQLLSKEIQELLKIESDLQAIQDKIPERAEAYVQNRQDLANQLHKVQDNINNQLSQARKYEATLKPIVNHLNEPLLKLRRLRTIDKYVKIFQTINDTMNKLNAAVKQNNMKVASTIFQNLTRVFLPMNSNSNNNNNNNDNNNNSINLQLFIKLQKYLEEKNIILKTYFSDKLVVKSKILNWGDNIENVIMVPQLYESIKKELFNELICLQISFERIRNKNSNEYINNNNHLWA